MRKLGKIALFVTLTIGLLIVSAIVGYKLNYPTYTYRYRITVEVMVDGVLRSGASVIEVRTTDYKVGSAETSGLRSQVLGDAIFLDLGKGRNVVAMLASQGGTFTDYPARIVLTHFGWDAVTSSELMKSDERQRRWDLRVGQMPTFVAFSDLNDPKTARIVSPHDFEKEFGPDVHFNRAWIEMTTDAVTRGIENRLSWWKSDGRPAGVAYRAWLGGQKAGPSIEPETVFKRD